MYNSFSVSDTRTRSKSDIETFDSSGHRLKELVDNLNVIKSAKVVLYDCVIDDIEQIQVKLTIYEIITLKVRYLYIDNTNFSINAV